MALQSSLFQDISIAYYKILAEKVNQFSTPFKGRYWLFFGKILEVSIILEKSKNFCQRVAQES